MQIYINSTSISSSWVTPAFFFFLQIHCVMHNRNQACNSKPELERKFSKVVYDQDSKYSSGPTTRVIFLSYYHFKTKSPLIQNGKNSK